jgi:hypothetical protein
MKCSTFSSAAPHGRHVGSQNITKIRPERGVQLFGQSYQKITMDLVGEIKSVPVTGLNFTGILLMSNDE